jgi:hypothetical protein
MGVQSKWGAFQIAAGATTPNGAVYYGLDDTGNLYQFPQPGCSGEGVYNVSLRGPLIDPPIISPVVHLDASGPAVVATLRNGDVWQMCPGATQGEYAGNIFSAAGVAAVGQVPSTRANGISPNRPNPFNPVTRVPYSLASAGRVTIKVFDVAGRLVRTMEDSVRPVGQYVAQWDGRDDHGIQLSSGTYFGRITFPDGTHSEQKLMILR